MKHDYRMYGWQISHYSGKLRSYLNYKGLDYEECPVNAYQLTRLFPQKVGALVMPVLQTREGEWLSDTSEIIETLEQRHPHLPVYPESACQLIASLILATWADEFWTPSSMHYRWSFPENYSRFREESGQKLLPFMPRFFQNWIADNIPAKKMRSYLPGIGVYQEQFSTIENWTSQQLDLLEEHLSIHPYLFGQRPTIADHALIGPLYAHLYGDPVPYRKLIAPRKNLKLWIERTHRGVNATGELLADDRIPDTLQPIFKSIFSEFYTMISEIAATTTVFIQEHKVNSGRSLPRSLNRIAFPMQGRQFFRKALPFSLWKAQCIRQRFSQLSDVEQIRVEQWLSNTGHSKIMRMDLGPQLQRKALATQLK